jgi:DNA helicase-2/ATP-dependent DNA helicase PcrA
LSFNRVANIPTRGLGARSLEIFYEWQQQSGLDLLNSLQKAADCNDLTPKAQKALIEVGDVINSFHLQSAALTPEHLLEKLLKRIDYISYLNDNTPQGEARIENVNELLSVAASYQEAGLAGFLEEVALVSDLDEVNSKTANKSAGGSAVTLMTLHSAKGLEFPVVFIVGLEESMFPHSRALYDAQEMEEERRLMYVGMTRAKNDLYLIYATSRVIYGGQTSNPPSRFLSDIEGTFAQNIDQPLPMPKQFASDEPRYVPDLSPGEVVRHQIFGEGTIIELDGDIATIRFKTGSTKKLDIGFAPLEKV